MTSASPDEELPIRIKLETDEEFVRPGFDELRELVGRIGGDGDHFVILDRVPHRPRCFMQTYRETGTDFELEYRDGDDQQYQVYVGEPDTVVATMVSWARQDADWKSAHEWELAFQHVPDELPPLDEAAASSAHDHAWELLTVGYDDFDTMAQRISEAAEPDSPITIEQAKALLEPLWMERVAEQESWQQVTDPDRVEHAFDRLEVAGITARSHYSCCVRCGTGEIRDEADPRDRGFVFFHYQDAENAVGDGELWLAFGSYSRDAADGTAVGREVVAALAAQGLTTRWDGSADRRIAVTDLEWKKRLE